MEPIRFRIEDALGLRTGVCIKQVRVLVDRECDCIRITGRLEMNDNAYPISPGFEPEVQADLLNNEDQVCFGAASTHDGCLKASKRVSFRLKLENVSKAIPYSSIEEIHLYLIFIRR